MLITDTYGEEISSVLHIVAGFHLNEYFRPKIMPETSENGESSLMTNIISEFEPALRDQRGNKALGIDGMESTILSKSFVLEGYPFCV